MYRICVMAFIANGDLETCPVSCLASGKVWISQKFHSNSASPSGMFQMPHGISDNRCIYLGKPNELLVNTDSGIWIINHLFQCRMQSLISILGLVFSKLQVAISDIHQC